MSSLPSYQDASFEIWHKNINNKPAEFVKATIIILFYFSKIIFASNVGITSGTVFVVKAWNGTNCFTENVENFGEPFLNYSDCYFVSHDHDIN